MHIKNKFRLRYNLKIWHKKDYFDIPNNVSESANLLQLTESLLNVNHAISIVGYWIFDSNYEKSLCLTQESLDVICSPLIGKKKLQCFNHYFTLFSTFWHKLIFKRDKHETSVNTGSIFR